MMAAVVQFATQAGQLAMADGHHHTHQHQDQGKAQAQARAHADLVQVHGAEDNEETGPASQVTRPWQWRRIGPPDACQCGAWGPLPMA